MAEYQQVGTVQAVYRYPVKSMRGEEMREALLSWYGVDGDRRYAFVKANNRTGFPWLTGREVAEMVRYIPRYLDPDHPLESAVVVTTPAGRKLPIESPDLLNELVEVYGSPAHLMFLKKGCHDAMPVSLLGADSAQAISTEAGLRSVDPRRFRPNLLVKAADGMPFSEEEWIDHTVRIGNSAQIRINRRNGRCSFTNVNPETAERDPRVLKTIAQMREEYLGLYASVEVPGSVCPGDPIYLVE